jgi:hypothetical protein
MSVECDWNDEMRLSGNWMRIGWIMIGIYRVESVDLMRWN